MAGISGGIYSTQSASTPSIQSGSTALAANPARLGWFIQNLGTNPLFILHGNGATSSVYTAVLQACTVAADGSGGTASQEEGVVYNGIITVAGTNPSYTATEWAP